jgi:KUP system potassium uptake protein
MAAMLAERPPHIVDGTAVYLTSNPEITPVALLHNLKHNRVLHSQNIIMNVANEMTPYVDREARLSIVPLNSRFVAATLRYGYMETPEVPNDLFGTSAIAPGVGGTSFFIGRHFLQPSHDVGLPFWQDIIFIFLQRNASDPTDFFRIPPNRVVELGTRMEI